MPTVRCPVCRRALRLPAHVEMRSAACPLCGAVFDVPDPRREGDDPPESSPSPAANEAKCSEAGDQVVKETGLLGLATLAEHDALPPADAQALVSASRRMRVAGIARLAHGMMCGCTESLASVTGLDVGGDLVTGFFVLGVLLRVAGFATVWRAATALTRRRNRSLVVTAGYVSFALSAWIMLGTLPWLVAVTQRVGAGDYFRPREATSLLFVACDGIVAVLGLIAGLKSRMALRRPGVRAGFR